MRAQCHPPRQRAAAPGHHGREGRALPSAVHASGASRRQERVSRLFKTWAWIAASDSGPTGVRCIPRAGSTATSTILPSSSDCRLLGRALLDRGPGLEEGKAADPFGRRIADEGVTTRIHGDAARLEGLIHPDLRRTPRPRRARAPARRCRRAGRRAERAGRRRRGQAGASMCPTPLRAGRARGAARGARATPAAATGI